MANMSYCRFQNTYHDLFDCYRALMSEGLSNLSGEEKFYAVKIYELCENFVEFYNAQNEE